MFGNDRNNQGLASDDQTVVPADDQQYIMSEPAQSNDPPQADDGYQVPVSVNITPPAPVIPTDLAMIKQQALQDLSPIIDHLEQSPEERFHITMMMLQATDDQNLVKQAYHAAKAIGDEKKRAKALLDVINEITYFTQQKEV